MIISVSTSYPIAPRLVKISKLFAYEHEDIRFISWNRKIDIDIPPLENELVFADKRTGLCGKIFGSAAFRRYLKQCIKEYKPDLIICRHWPAFFIVASLVHNKPKIVYDICDVPNSKAIKQTEKYFIRKNTILLLASRFFKDKYSNKAIVVENRVSNRVSQPCKSKAETSNGTLRLAYLGVVRYRKILENLISAVSQLSKVTLSIYGFGNDTEMLKEFAKSLKAENVAFFGSYRQDELPEIYSNCDLVWAAYPYESRNVKSAISNKYFETKHFQVPGVYSINTDLGALVAKDKTGFLIDPYDTEKIRELLEKLRENRTLLGAVTAQLQATNRNECWEDYDLRYLRDD